MFGRGKGDRQRGATLVEYALLTAVFVAVVGLVAVELTDSSGDFLEDTGNQVAEPAVLEFDGEATGP